MSDRREEILLSEFSKSVDEKGVPVGDAVRDSLVFKSSAISAMDEYMKECCLELLEYMAKNLVICGHWSSLDGFLFKHNGKLITKEQLFENFL